MLLLGLLVVVPAEALCIAVALRLVSLMMAPVLGLGHARPILVDNAVVRVVLGKVGGSLGLAGLVLVILGIVRRLIRVVVAVVVPLRATMAASGVGLVAVASAAHVGVLV